MFPCGEDSDGCQHLLIGRVNVLVHNCGIEKVAIELLNTAGLISTAFIVILLCMCVYVCVCKKNSIIGKELISENYSKIIINVERVKCSPPPPSSTHSEQGMALLVVHTSRGVQFTHAIGRSCLHKDHQRPELRCAQQFQSLSR